MALPALRRFVESSVPAVRQAEGIDGQAERLFSDRAKQAKEFATLRAHARDFKAPVPGEGVLAESLDTALYGQDINRPGPYTLAMQTAARLIDFGDVDGAAEYIRACRESRRGQADPVQANQTIKAMLARHSPLGSIPMKHRAEFLAQYDREEQDRLMKMQGEWGNIAAKAMTKAAEKR
jgi:hypothetical protein